MLYRLTGVREYLVFDPSGEFLGEPLRGWHRAGGNWRPWQPAVRSDGTRVWESPVLGLAVRPEGLLLRFDHPERGTLPVRRELVVARAREQAARQAAEQAAIAEQGARQAAEQAARAAEERAVRREQELEAARVEIARLQAQLSDSP